MKLYVGNLPFSASEDELGDTFGEFGAVASVKIINDRETGRSKGFGFVEMNNDEEAKAAMSELDGKDFGGRNLKVNEAKPREERPRGGFRGGDRRSNNRW